MRRLPTLLIALTFLCCAGAPAWACSVLVLPPGAVPPPAPPPDQTAIDLYKRSGEYLIVARVSRVEPQPRSQVIAQVEVLETIKGSAPYHANQMRLTQGMPGMCQEPGPYADSVILIGVDKTSGFPSGIWWTRPEADVLRELQRLGRRRNGA